MRFPVATIPLREAAALPEARFTSTSPARTVQLSRPDGLSRGDWWALRDRDVDHVPEQSVLELPEATVAGRDGWVVVGGRVVDGLWQEAGFPVGQMLPRGFETGRVRLAGTTASLLMPWLPNYYHWTVQCVPRVHRVREAVGEVDQWLVPAGAPAYVGQWLDVLGIPVEQRVEVDGRRRLLDLERLVVSTIPGRNRWVLPREVDAVRSHFPPPVAGGRRIYVTRPGADRRRVVNAEEVAAVARDLGFDLVDLARLSVREEVALFASASVVAGVHGAGLTNLVFCAPGTQVVELTPRGLVYPTFAKLAEASGVSHRFLLGVEPRLPWPLRFPDVESDLVVDVRAFSAAVERAADPVR